MYVRGKYLWYGDDLSDAYRVRKAVFVDELGMDESLVFDEFDKVSVHGIVFNQSEKVVASGRIALIEDEYRLGKIAVARDSRGKLFGDFLVRMLIDKGYQAGAQRIMVHAQLQAIPFYEKIGFRKCGEVFHDYDDIDVQPMELPKGSLCKKCQTM